jgi:hypothetical protein
MRPEDALFRDPGKTRKTRKSPKARWTARAGTSVMIPKLKRNGRGDAIHNW